MMERVATLQHDQRLPATVAAEPLFDAEGGRVKG